MPDVAHTTASGLSAAVAAAANDAMSAGSLRRIGVDVVDIGRLENQIDIGGARFVAKLLTPAEIAKCAGRSERVATRVAAKEAAAKVLGTGFRGVRWHDIEVVTAPNGAPSLRLTGNAASTALRLGLDALAVSCSHENGFAIAIVVGESRDSGSLAQDAPMGGDGL